MYCSRCGAILPAGAAFCSACGQTVAPTPDTGSAPMPPAVPPPGTPPMAVPPYGYQQYAYQRPPAPQFPYADFWLRLVAYLIDSALFGVVLGVLVFAGFLLLGGAAYFEHLGGDFNHPNPVLPALLVMSIMGLFLVMIVAAWLYYALMESSPRQGTLGKILLGLIVTDLQGRPISFGRASGRFFSRIITRMVPLFIGFIMAAFTEKRQALHDMIASCLVLKKT